MNKGILWGVLDAASHAQLSHAVPPRFQTVYCHHTTLFYNVELADHANLLNRQFMAIATYQCWDADVQAVRLTLPPGIPCGIQYPHVTISTAPDIPPARANRMLLGLHRSQPVNLPLRFTIEWRQQQAQLLTNQQTKG